MAILKKSKQVENYLRNAIVTGRWSAGSMLPSERELLAEFGISRATLRDALNSLCNEGLIIRKQGSGTYVAETTEHRQFAITGSASCISSSLGYWHQDILEKAQKKVAAAGYKAVFWIGDSTSLSSFLESTALFENSNIRQTVGVFNNVCIEGFDQKLAQEGVPCININHGVPVGKYSIVLDYAELSDRAAQILKSHGYNDFMVMCEPTRAFSNDSVIRQLQTNLIQLYRRTVDYDETRLLTVDTTNGFHNVYERFKEVWASSSRPRALFFFDDAFFDVASRAILELGIKVPEELAIVTHANVGRTFHFPVSLTRVGFSADDVIKAAWNMYQQVIDGREIDSSVVLIPPVVKHGDSL